MTVLGRFIAICCVNFCTSVVVILAPTMLIFVANITLHRLISFHNNTYCQLDIAGTVYHLVIYMQSNKIHKVFQ
jgi:hypothetical protein